MAEAKARTERPLSPHLQIYAPLINMVMSIFHRLTGMALYAGALLFTWWLIAAAAGPDHFATVNAVFGSWPGRVVLFSYSWALLHHMLGGIRHLIWDTGRGLDIPTVNLLSWGTIAGSATLTILLWAGALLARGAL